MYIHAFLSILLGCLIEFLQGVSAAKSDYTTTHVFQNMFDIKAWLKPHMLPLHNHSHPHIFRFFKANSGTTCMQYKQWRHHAWEPQSSSGIRLLKVYF